MVRQTVAVILVVMMAVSLGTTVGAATTSPSQPLETNEPKSLSGSNNPVPAGADTSTSSVVFAIDSTSDGTFEDSTEQNESNESSSNQSEDPLGVVNGIRHNDSLNINLTDGLTEDEMDDYVHRSMARVEYVRELKFNDTVDVEILSREEFRNQSRESDSEQDFDAWNNQVWKALFIVGDDVDIDDSFDEVRGEAVAGFYNTQTNNITLVTESPDEAIIEEKTLIHELTHALQDQHFDLESDHLAGSTQDAQLARLGLIEGDAEYVTMRYEERCDVEWECLDSGVSGSETNRQGAFNLGVWAVMFQPYSDGPAYVHEIVEQGGWEEVNELYSDPPTTASEIIHREPYHPVPIRFNDSSTDEWVKYDDSGDNGTDRVGEASIFVMFWYQSLEYNADIVEWRDFQTDEHQYSVHDYRSDISEGWTNDVVVPYRNVEDAERNGYVWITTWQTAVDAAAFRRGFLGLMATHEAVRIDNQTWYVADGPFAGTYRVVLDGTSVTIVHGPSLNAVNDLRPELNSTDHSPDFGIDPIFPTDPTTVPDVEGTADDSTTEPDHEPITMVGFGLLIAIVSILAYTLGIHKS